MLFDANFIKILRRNDTPVSILSWARFLLSRMTARSLGREQNTAEDENRDN